MVQVIVGDSNDFNAMVYGYERHPGTVSYLENQFSNISSTLTETGRNFFSNAKQIFEQFTSSDAMRAARAALRKAGSNFQRDEIRYMSDLGEIQNAPPAMQRVIMAEPTIRELWQQQRMDGYSDTYVDLYPGFIAEEHYDFRRINNGVVRESDVPEADWMVREYIDDLVDGDRERDIDEKADAIGTQEAAVEWVRLGEDPTSVFGGKL